MDCIHSTPETITEVHQESHCENVTKSPPQNQEHNRQGNSNSGKGQEHRRQIANRIGQHSKGGRNHCKELYKTSNQILNEIKSRTKKIKDSLKSINHQRHHP
nr:MAG TPA: hypothetical protein [Inoviridae sp.]